MKRLVLMLALAFPLLTDAEFLSFDLKSVSPEMKEIQGKVNDLIMGHIEPPSDWFVEEHKDLFQNADVVNIFLNRYKEGLLSKNKQFNIRDSAIREETITVFELLFYAKDFDSIYTVASWLHSVMNYEQYTYALAVALIHRQDIIVKMPPWYEVFPNYFVQKKYLEELKTLKDGYDPSNGPDAIVVEQTITTNGPSFFAEDPELANMFYNWQLEFPSWMDPVKYGISDEKKWSELYFAYHYQIFSAFMIYADASMGNDFLKDWNHISQWNWLNLQFGFGDGLVNSVGQPIKQVTVPANHVDPKVEAADKIFLPSDEVHADDLGKLEQFWKSLRIDKTATVFNLTGSLDSNFFGSFYDTMVDFLATYDSNPEKDGGNLAGYPLTALKDPQFYSVLDKVTFPMYKPDDITNPRPMDNMKFASVQVNEVKTMYRAFDMDLSRYMDKDAPRGRFKVRQMVMDHTPFLVTMTIENSGSEPRDIVVRLLMSPHSEYSRKHPPLTIAVRTNSFYIISMEIDRFILTVPPGNLTIVRDLKDSPVFINGGKESVQCGVPNRLIVPRRTGKGVNMSLVAVMRDYKRPKADTAPSGEGEYYRKSILCGSRLLDDGLPVGHPSWDDGHGISHLERKQEVHTEFTVGATDENNEI